MTKPMQKLIIAGALSILMLSGASVVNAAAIESKSLIPDLNFQVPIGTEQSIKIIEVRKESVDGKPTEVVYGTGIGIYIAIVYKWLLGSMAIVSVLIIMVAGLMWMTAAGNKSRIGEAKKLIENALLGLAVLFGSYTILYALNPDLVNIGPLRLGQKIESISLPPSTTPTSDQITKSGSTVVGKTTGENCSAKLRWDSNLTKMTGAQIREQMTGAGAPQGLINLSDNIAAFAEKYQIDAALAMGVWNHDSSFATAGWGKFCKNPGNMRNDVISGMHGRTECDKGSCFECYDNWTADSIEDWFRYMSLYKKPPAAVTVTDMIHIYAPRGDNNNPEKYADSICGTFVSLAKKYSSPNATKIQNDCACK